MQIHVFNDLTFHSKIKSLLEDNLLLFSAQSITLLGITFLIIFYVLANNFLVGV